jgi:hypothetical protein
VKSDAVVCFEGGEPTFEGRVFSSHFFRFEDTQTVKIRQFGGVPVLFDEELFEPTDLTLTCTKIKAMLVQLWEELDSVFGHLWVFSLDWPFKVLVLRL